MRQGRKVPWIIASLWFSSGSFATGPDADGAEGPAPQAEEMALDAPDLRGAKLLDHGSDGARFTLAFVAEGYSEADLERYRADVDRLLFQAEGGPAIPGVFERDVFKEHRQAFNVYRLDTPSVHSGVSYEAHVPPSKQPASAPRRKRRVHSTAFGTIYTGEWKSCWIRETPGSLGAVERELEARGIDAHIVIVLVNEDEFGGCARHDGNVLYLTRGSGAAVMAHELGHGLANLLDEYTPNGRETVRYTGKLSRTNCATSESPWWRPAPFDSPPVEGCGLFGRGIFRSADRCRMVDNHSPFCKVCATLLAESLAVHAVHGGGAAVPRAAILVQLRKGEGGSIWTEIVAAKPSLLLPHRTEGATGQISLSGGDAAASVTEEMMLPLFKARAVNLQGYAHRFVEEDRTAVVLRLTEADLQAVLAGQAGLAADQRDSEGSLKRVLEVEPEIVRESVEELVAPAGWTPAAVAKSADGPPDLSAPSAARGVRIKRTARGLVLVR